VVLRAYPTVRTAWAAMMRGEIDVLYDVSRDAVEFAGSSDVALYSYLRHYVYLIAFNSARPLFAPTPVRRALNAAIDRDALIKSVLRGQGAPASGPFWPLHWAFDPSLPRYAYDPSLAGAALDAAGLRLVRRPDGRRSRMRFTCILPANWVVWERITLNVQKQLYDIGVDMQLQVLPEKEFNERIRAGDFDAVMLEMRSGPFLSRPYVYWRWGGEQTEYNVFGYRSAAADRWFEGIRAAGSDAEYRAAAAQLQRAMRDDPPALFLAWTQRTRAVSRRFAVPVDATRDPMPSFAQWRAGAAR
jgi:peptide/nickel transport system substrate-binding protein